MTHDDCVRLARRGLWLLEPGVTLRPLGPFTAGTPLGRRSYAVVYAGVPIVTWHADGRVVLEARGRYSTAVRELMRRYSGADVRLCGGRWKVGRRPYYDGMNVGAEACGDFMRDALEAHKCSRSRPNTSSRT